MGKKVLIATIEFESSEADKPGKIGATDEEGHAMNETELKHVIAMLLEDAKRLQQVEPNAGTEARIWLANKTLNSFKELNGFARGSGISTEHQLS